MGDRPAHRLCASVARRWKASLPEGAAECPLAATSVLDATVALLAVHRSGGGLDLQALMACPIDELLLDVGTILTDINRRTGRVEGLIPIKHRAA